MAESAVGTATASVTPAPGAVRPLLSFHVALSALITVPVFFCLRSRIGDPDLWWHLRNAQLLLTTGHFSLADIYSYTAAGTTRIPHEWLAEIPYYLAFRAAGLRGVLLVALLVSDAIILGIFWLCYDASGDIKNSFLTTVFASLIITVSLGPRTLLFGWLLLVLLLVLLSRFRAGNSGVIFAVPLLFTVWVNTHGSWLMGLIVFSIALASGLVEGTWGQVDARRWSPMERRHLLTAGIATIPALFVNPTGYHAILYPFHLAFRQQLGIAYVQEWASVDFHTPRGKLMMVALLVVLGLALLSRCRWTLLEVGFLFLTVYMSLTYMRLSFLAALLLMPIVARRLDLLSPYRAEADKPLLNGVIVLVVVAITLLKMPASAQLERDVARDFPVNAVKYLRANAHGAHVFHDYVWGGYLIWHAPDIPVFIDGREEIYEPREVFRAYLEAMQLRDTFGVLDRYQVDWVMLRPDAAAAYLLEHSSGWKVEFRDQNSVVLRRTLVRKSSDHDQTTRTAPIKDAGR